MRIRSGLANATCCHGELWSYPPVLTANHPVSDGVTTHENFGNNLSDQA